jgi:DnaJ-domain-containing protein 1
LFNLKKPGNILDIDRAESVFTLFFLFIRDPALSGDEQIELDEVLREIFLGHAIPRQARKRLHEMYIRIMKNPPVFVHSVNDLIRDLKGDRDALVSFIKILLRLISDDGMLSMRHCEDLRYLISQCNISEADFEEFTEEEQLLISLTSSFQYSANAPDTSSLYLLLGCTPDASVEEIKKAYRALAMKYHPDRSGNGISETSGSEKQIRKFQEIQLAYSTLLNILNAT